MATFRHYRDGGSKGINYKLVPNEKVMSDTLSKKGESLSAMLKKITEFRYLKKFV